MNWPVTADSPAAGAPPPYNRLPLEFGSEYLRALRIGEARVEEHFASHFGSLLEARLRRDPLQACMAEDIRQETLARVLQRIRTGKQLSHPAKLHSFVLGVCRNVVREHCRHYARHLRPGSAAEPADPRSNQEEPLVRQERQNLLKRSLRQMSRRDRQILWLIFFEGRGRGEVSRLFGYSEEYFRVVLHRAMRRLRSLLLRDILDDMPLLHSLQKKPRKRASILASF